jgi:hypothetical protein
MMHCVLGLREKGCKNVQGKKVCAKKRVQKHARKERVFSFICIVFPAPSCTEA